MITNCSPIVAIVVVSANSIALPAWGKRSPTSRSISKRLFAVLDGIQYHQNLTTVQAQLLNACHSLAPALGLCASALSVLTGGCSKNGPATVSTATTTSDSAPATAYLGKDQDGIAWLLLRPSGAAVLLTASCGVQEIYHKAIVFSYDDGNATPAAKHLGCL